MELTDKQKKWIVIHFKNTKNDDIMLKIGIKHSALHRFAREHGLKKTKQFVKKCQAATTEAARLVNKRNNWPPKGYMIPNMEQNCFKKGVTPEQRLGKKKNALRIARSAESRRKTVLAEKRRVLFGLPQKTKLKVVAGHSSKSSFKHTLKKRGYLVCRASRQIGYNESTDRSLKSEITAKKYGFTIFEQTTCEYGKN